MDENEVKQIVRSEYGKIAAQTPSESACGCGTGSESGCGPTNLISSEGIGYTEDDISKIPDDAILGLGCGNPIATSDIKEGETVLDLGSGGGIDCFLAASKVGKNGKVIGVDMTAEMINRARETLKKENHENVEFRLGEIENLPVADNIVDLIISNCVINLSPDKEKVFQEAYRVLKPGGRINVSDIVLTKDLPENIKNDPNSYVGCISGALKEELYIAFIKKAGFENVLVTKNFKTGGFAKSVTVRAHKPKNI
jgi:SAM-dependent methyltransferase